MKTDWNDDFVHYWKNYKPPARPSISELAFIKGKILSFTNPRVLILGATSEYRQLCGELKIPVTLFDFNDYNVKYLASEVKNKPQERLIKGNWMEHVPDEKFDVVLGDCVLNIIGNDNIPILCNNISKILSNNGIFITKTYIRNQGENYSLKEAIEQYRKNRQGQEFIAGTQRQVMIATMGVKDTCFMYEAWNVLKKLRDEKIITDSELEEYEKIAYKDRKFLFQIPYKESLNKILFNRFKIKEIFYGSESYQENHYPVHVMAKRL